MARCKNIVTAKTAAELEAITQAAVGPVVVSFESDTCGACRRQKPEIERLACRRPEVTVVRVDVESSGPLADAFGVQFMPTLYLGDGGKPLSRSSATEVEGARELRKALDAKRKVKP